MNLFSKYFIVFVLPLFGFSAELIINGDFETGNFLGWTALAQSGSDGSWVVYSGDILPLSSYPFYPPPYGNYAAAGDENNPSSLILYQDVYLPLNSSATLTYTYYYNLPSGIGADFVNPPSLYYTDAPNQQLRIDILKTPSDPFSVLESDVLENLFSTPPGTPLTLAPTKVSFDLSKYSGQTIRLRFACVSELWFLFLGIDGVSIETKSSNELLDNLIQHSNCIPLKGF